MMCCDHGWFLGIFQRCSSQEMVGTEPLTKPSPDVGFAQKTLFKAIASRSLGEEAKVLTLW